VHEPLQHQVKNDYLQVVNYSDVIGQYASKTRLQNMVEENRIAHALLFTGAEGSGNLPLAMGFAAHLLCKQKTPQGACGHCNSCIQSNKLTHPDLHLVFPIALNKEIRNSAYWMKEFRVAYLKNPYLSLEDWFNEISAENKQPIIGTDEAGDILRKLSYTSFDGQYKIILMWLPEKMNQEASNKILKVLEEPTDNTIFLLASHQPDQLLSTILSRVQQIPLSKLSNEDISKHLQTKHGKTTGEAEQIALLADGNFNEALRMLEEDALGESLMNHFQSFMRLAFSFDFPKVLAWVDENASLGREKQKRFFQYGLEVFRDCLMYNYGNRDLVRLNGAERSFLEKFAPFVNQKNYEKLIEEFNSNYYYIERNANPKILFMDLIIKCNALIVQPRRN
jgi:DNA polymerase-3 subunit delta'